MKSPGLFWLGQTMKLPFWPSFRSSSFACWPVAYAWNHLHGKRSQIYIWPRPAKRQDSLSIQPSPSFLYTFRWPSLGEGYELMYADEKYDFGWRRRPFAAGVRSNCSVGKYHVIAHVRLGSKQRHLKGHHFLWYSVFTILLPASEGMQIQIG